MSQTITKRTEALSRVTGIAVDVFGTIVDWRGTIIDEGMRLKSTVDWHAFAYEWLKGYRSGVERVRKGERPWVPLDALLLESFEKLVRDFHLEKEDKKKLEMLGQVWHRLSPWPDSIPGLKKISANYRVAALSNGNTILLIDMAKNAGLPWDSIVSAEQVKKYKPEKEVYQLAAESLGPLPEQVIYVASHKWDLLASKALGFKTAYIPRPNELGSSIPPEDPYPDPTFDLNASDFIDLAAKLAVA